MKILITGICGFVGSQLAKAWLDARENLQIFGLDNLTRPGSELNRAELKKYGVRFFHGDIRLSSDFESLPDVDWVVDAAANPSVLAGIDGQVSSRQLVEHNLFGTLNILEYCKRSHAGFILLSTSRVYSISGLAKIDVESIDGRFQPKKNQTFSDGMSSAGIRETFSTAPPLSLYGTTKLASEKLALEYQEAFGFPVWINRCGVLAGAGQFGRADQGIFAFWINSWLRHKPLQYIGFGGDGHQVRDCLHPRDLISLLERQVDADDESLPRVVNLGGGVANAMSLAELSRWCRDRFGPREVAKTETNRHYDIPWLVMDSSLAHDVWGWQPQTSLEEVLEEIAAHAQENPNWLEVSGCHE